MKTIVIPGTELRVSQLCMGSAEFGANISVATAPMLLDEFVRLGGNFIDTAHVYSDWIPNTKSTSEKTIGAWLKATGLRDQLVISTKGGHPLLTSMYVSRLSRTEIERDLNESLEYLGIDSIDIYWLHRDDIAIPVGELIDILNDQIAAGKIRYFGLSNWTCARIQAASEYAASKGLHGPAANQVMWSLAEPTVENFPDKTIVAMDRTSLDFHRRSGMPMMAYTSQAHGFFTKLADGANIRDVDLAIYNNATNVKRLDRIRELAARYHVQIADVVLSYLLSQPFVTIPIVGCRSIDQIQASIKSADLTLTAAEMAYLEDN